MRWPLLLAAVAVTAVACSDEPPRASVPSPTRSSATTPAEGTHPPREALVYSAVIRRLVTKDHTFGRGRSPFRVVYVVDGVVEGAGHPRRDYFTPGHPFGEGVAAAIRDELEDDLPPLRFVDDGEDALRSVRTGAVENRGVVISLGPIQRKNGHVHVANTLWCGGKCAQWLTYVLSERNGRWVVTRSGPATIS